MPVWPPAGTLDQVVNVSCRLRSRFMRAFRRVLLAAAAGVLIGVIVRLRGSGGVPPQHGGWRELHDDELRG